MSEDEIGRIQQLFLDALKIPDENRDAWLSSQCAGDAELLHKVRVLLQNDSPARDPLEDGLERAIYDLPNLKNMAFAADEGVNADSEPVVNGDHLLTKLSDIGLLSQEEIVTLSKAFPSGEIPSDSRQIASQLVAEGKLTEFQANALLRGRPELLIDKYLILDLLDTGGMGMVFKAIHRPMNRLVAVKMISPHLLLLPEQVKRFQREVRVAATLEHPNIVRAYDADQTRGTHFLVMEYVRGETLTKIVRDKGPLSVELAVSCVLQAANGLQYAHKLGVIHRDIKPSNLMLTGDDQVKVLDLGLANIDESFRLAQQSSPSANEDVEPPQPSNVDLTEAGAVLGTVSFMAPEQSLNAKHADARSDIYSLGCTLYFLLIGEPPFGGDSLFQVFLQHRDGTIPSLRDKRPDVPETVDTLFQKMLAKAADERFQSTGEVIAAIEDCEIVLPAKKRKVAPANQTATSQTSNNHTPKTSPSGKPKPRGLWRAIGVICLLSALFWSYQQWKPGPFDQSNDQNSTANGEPQTLDASVRPSNGPSIVDAQAGNVALSFDGVDSYVEIPTLTDVGRNSVTLEVWVTPHEQLDPYREKSWIGNSLTTGMNLVLRPDDRWGIAYYNPKNPEAIRGYTYASSDSIAEFGQRQHVASVVDLDAHVLRLYIDGKKRAESSITPLDFRSSPLALHFGAVASGKSRRQLFANGLLDEVRISSVARYTADFTPSERLETDEQTLALYHLDEGIGDRLIDASANGHDGKIVRAKWVSRDRESTLADGSLTAADLLATGKWEWRVVEQIRLPAGSPKDISSGDMTEDALTLVFAAGQFPIRDLWITTRKSYSSDWSLPIKLSNRINSDRPDLGPTISPDGRTLQFSRADSGKGRQSFVSHRLSLKEPWNEPARFIFERKIQASLNVTTNGLGLVMSDFGQKKPNRKFNLNLILYRRMSLDSQWIEQKSLETAINTDVSENSGTLSDDGRLLIFQRAELGKDGKEDGNLWMTIRDDWISPWSEPIRMKHLNSPQRELSPCLLDDGKTLLFGSNRPSDQGGSNLYLARLVRKRNELNTRGMIDLLAEIDCSRDVRGNDSNWVWSRDEDGGCLGRQNVKDINSSSRLVFPIQVQSDYELEIQFEPRANGILGVNLPLHGKTAHLELRIDSLRGLSFIGGKFFPAAETFSLPLKNNTKHRLNVFVTHSGDDVSILATVNDQAFVSYDGPLQRVSNHPWGWTKTEFSFRTFADVKIHSATFTPITAADLLKTGEWEWRVEKNMGPPLCKPAADASADMTADGLTIVFVSNRVRGFGDGDLWMATRASRNEAWSEPVNLGDEINTPGPEDYVTISSDGKKLMFTRSVSGGKEAPLFVSERVSLASSWSKPTLHELNVGRHQGPLDLTRDGLSLIVMKWGRKSDSDQYTPDLWWSRRASLFASWPSPLPLGPLVNTNEVEFAGTLSNDGRLLIFQRGWAGTKATGGPLVSDLWMSTRQHSDASWSDPVPIDSINSSRRDEKPRLLPDGKSLLFSSDRPGGNGELDIYLARLVKKETSEKRTGSTPIDKPVPAADDEDVPTRSVSNDRLISEPGRIDFTQVQPGRLPSGWEGSPLVGIDKIAGIPSLQLVATGDGAKGATVSNNNVTLGGEFFIEFQILAKTYDELLLELSTSDNDETLSLTFDADRNSDWTVKTEGREYQQLKVCGLSEKVQTWFRIEQSEKGLFVGIDGMRAGNKQIGEASQMTFDKLSLSFLRGTASMKIQNLRWGPLKAVEGGEVEPFAPTANKLQPNGLPQGWQRIGGTNASATQRFAANDLKTGEDFAVDFGVNVAQQGKFNINLIGASSNPTLPIHFDFGRGALNVATVGSSTRFDYREKQSYEFQIRRRNGRIEIQFDDPNNIRSIDATPFGTFDRIEVEYLTPADRVEINPLPTVR